METSNLNDRLYLTKEQRHIIYERALIEYKKDKAHHEITGMCRSIRLAILSLITSSSVLDGISLNDIDPYDNLNCYPEILSKKPAIPFDEFYWFSLRDQQSRINIIRKAIEETK